MNLRRAGTMIAVTVLILTLTSGTSLADQSATTLETPDQAANGSEITVKIHVVHSANNFFHYTNWVKVTVNGAEAASWEYSAFDLPDGARFTKELKVTINGPTEVAAEANCNLHGSAGPAQKTIKLKP